MSHREIINRFGGQKDFADAVGANYEAVKKWHQRGRIPAAHWQIVIEAARERGWSDITAESLLRSLCNHLGGSAEGNGMAAANAA